MVRHEYLSYNSIDIRCNLLFGRAYRTYNFWKKTSSYRCVGLVNRKGNHTVPFYLSSRWSLHICLHEDYYSLVWRHVRFCIHMLGRFKISDFTEVCLRYLQGFLHLLRSICLHVENEPLMWTGDYSHICEVTDIWYFDLSRVIIMFDDIHICNIVYIWTN